MTPREAEIVTAYTGYFLGDFATFQEYVEEKLGRPVWTHEMGNPATAELIHARSRADFTALKVE